MLDKLNYAAAQAQQAHPSMTADAIALGLSLAAISTAFLTWLDLAFKVAIGGLSIALLIVRIRKHLK